MKHSVLLLTGLALFAGCTTDPITPSDNAGQPLETPAALTAGQQRDLVTLRQATAKFHRIEIADQAGYHNQAPPGCFVDSHGTGAMGYHFMNTDYIGTLEVTRPQLVIYEPEKNGQYRLVGVEYIVPGNPTDTPPVLFGQSLHYNAAFGVWVLHVWAWKNNTLGIFNDWNPDVSCQYATSIFSASVSHH